MRLKVSLNSDSVGVKKIFKIYTQEACEQTRDTLFHIDCDVISKEKAQDLVDKMDRTLTQRTDCNITLCGLFPTRGKIYRLMSFIKKLNLTKKLVQAKINELNLKSNFLGFLRKYLIIRILRQNL